MPLFNNNVLEYTDCKYIPFKGLGKPIPKTPEQMFGELKGMTANYAEIVSHNVAKTTAESIAKSIAQSATTVAETKAESVAQSTATTVAQAAARSVAESLMPKPATQTPPATGTQGSVGSGTKYALEDHTHEVRARRARVTLAAGTGIYAGKFVATWVFDKPFVTKPIIVCSPEDDGGNPVIAEAITASFTKNAQGLWTSVVIRGWRSQPIPQNLVSVLVTGVFNLFGASTVGVVVGLTAAEETPIV